MSGGSHDLQAKSNFATQLCPGVRPGRGQKKIARFREPTGRLAPLASMNHCYAQAINANTPSRGESLSTTGNRRSSNWDCQTTRGNTQPGALGIIMQLGPAFRRLAMLFLLAWLAAPVVSVAATIWTGPVTTFTDVAGSDPTFPAIQTSDVRRLARP